MVALVSRALAPAETGHVAQDLGMVGRELIRGRHDLGTPRRRVAWLKWDRRQVGLLARSKLRDGGRLGDRFCVAARSSLSRGGRALGR